MIELYLKHYRIQVIDEYGEIIYKGRNQLATKFIYIWLYDDHFYPIISTGAFLQNNYYCDYCNKDYQLPESHVCEHKCQYCLRKTCEKTDIVECEHCNFTVNNKKCLELHLKKCSSKNICPVCNFKRRIRGVHVCIGEFYCLNCKKAVKFDNHECYLQTIQEDNLRKKKKNMHK